MEFGFTEGQEKLRKEIREFFMNELPEDYEPGFNNMMGEEVQDWWIKLKEKAIKNGYYVPGWPKEYGGSGFTEIEQSILDEEQGRFGVTWPDFLGLHLVGPSLMMFGTEEQKKDGYRPSPRVRRFALRHSLNRMPGPTRLTSDAGRKKMEMTLFLTVRNCLSVGGMSPHGFLPWQGPAISYPSIEGSACFCFRRIFRASHTDRYQPWAGEDKIMCSLIMSGCRRIIC